MSFKLEEGDSELEVGRFVLGMTSGEERAEVCVYDAGDIYGQHGTGQGEKWLSAPTRKEEAGICHDDTMR